MMYINFPIKSHSVPLSQAYPNPRNHPLVQSRPVAGLQHVRDLGWLDYRTYPVEVSGSGPVMYSLLQNVFMSD